MINKLVFQNMLTFGGNHVHEIDFSTPNVAEISGDNGTGKSNITRILKMATHFDYPFVQNKLVNDRSENGFVEIHTDTYIVKHEYTKKHGLKSVQVYDLDMNLKDTGGVSSTKKWVSENIFPIPKDMFYNVFIPNISNFKSFIGMKPSDTKLIRDELFSLTSINKKLEKVKNNLSELEKQITNIQQETDTKKNFIDHINTQIVEAEEELKEKTAEKTAEIELEIKAKSDTKATLEEEIKLKKLDIKNLTDKLVYIRHKEKHKENLELEFKSKELAVELLAEEKSVNDSNKILTIIDTKELIKRKNDLEMEILKLETTNETELKTTKTLELESERLSKNIMCSQLKDVCDNVVVLDEEINILSKEINILSEEKEKISSDYAEVKSKYNETVEKLKIIELGETCPTCSQPIPDSLVEMKDVLIADKQSKHNDLLLKVDLSNSKKKDMEAKTSLLNSSTSKRLNVLKEQTSLKETLGDISEIVLINVLEAEQMLADVSKKISEKNNLLNSNTKVISVNKSLIDSIIVGDIETDIETDGLDKEKINDILLASNERIGFLKSQIKTIDEKIALVLLEISKLSNKDMCKDVDVDMTTLSLEETVESRNSDIFSLENRVLVLETELVAKRKELEQIKESKVDSTLERLINIKEAKTEEINSSEKSLRIKHKKKDNYKALEFVYSDAGLKKWILSKIRKSFTKSVNDDLNKFGLVAKFDDDFAVTLSKNGFDMPNEAISTGQKKIFDTIVCMNFILLYSSKNNIKLPIILDECLANLRKANAEKLVKLVKEKLVSKGFSVKFVNHGKLNDNLCDLTYLLSDEKQYTNISVK